jgi:hypothetical protein
MTGVNGFAASLDVLGVLQSIRRDESGGWCIELLGTSRELLTAGAVTADMLALPASGRRIGWDATGDRYRICRCGLARYAVTRWISLRPKHSRGNVISFPIYGPKEVRP